MQTRWMELEPCRPAKSQSTARSWSACPPTIRSAGTHRGLGGTSNQPSPVVQAKNMLLLPSSPHPSSSLLNKHFCSSHHNFRDRALETLAALAPSFRYVGLFCPNCTVRPIRTSPRCRQALNLQPRTRSRYPSTAQLAAAAATAHHHGSQPLCEAYCEHTTCCPPIESLHDGCRGPSSSSLRFSGLASQILTPPSCVSLRVLWCCCWRCCR